jgi:hypothetical protein
MKTQDIWESNTMMKNWYSYFYGFIYFLPHKVTIICHQLIYIQLCIWPVWYTPKCLYYNLQMAGIPQIKTKIITEYSVKPTLQMDWKRLSFYYNQYLLSGTSTKLTTNNLFQMLPHSRRTRVTSRTTESSMGITDSNNLHKQMCPDVV